MKLLIDMYVCLVSVWRTRHVSQLVWLSSVLLNKTDTTYSYIQGDIVWVYFTVRLSALSYNHNNFYFSKYGYILK